MHAALSPTPQTVPTTARPAASPTPGLDVDGDGTADAATTRFVGKHRALLAVQLGNRKSLTSKTFALYAGDGAGTVSGFDINGDGRAELFVEAPGADGVGYDLFTMVGSSLVAVPPPKGQEAPYLYVGGGRYYESTFRCTGGRLVEVKEAPAVSSTASLPPDPPYLVTSTTYALTSGRLIQTASRTVRAADHAAAQRLLASPSDGCGTRP
ncbi:hypothetical protein acdb102_34870 [Acidothermaceae bacterium B102]|nr:hypothetical protein acdb102_34870 [Acidothermaceae bacterium B102]